MLGKVKTRLMKAKILLILPVVASVLALSVSSASADFGPIKWDSTHVAFALPGSEPAGPPSTRVIWQMTLWHNGTMEGRETGTQGQLLNLWVPQVGDCKFQIDARNLTANPNVIVYSWAGVILGCGGS
ncbi:MAG TPA: hypothetical protein VMR34_03475 [Candidatus Saccharimonadales bacterium]|nr:hypothetical protein [Candidatus Saccharimonadales bacterium]